MDWRRLYALLDAEILHAAERRRADTQRLDAAVARERERAAVERRLAGRRRVMEAIVDVGIYWPGDRW